MWIVQANGALLSSVVFYAFVSRASQPIRRAKKKKQLRVGLHTCQELSIGCDQGKKPRSHKPLAWTSRPWIMMLYHIPSVPTKLYLPAVSGNMPQPTQKQKKKKKKKRHQVMKPHPGVAIPARSPLNMRSRGVPHAYRSSRPVSCATCGRTGYQSKTSCSSGQ